MKPFSLTLEDSMLKVNISRLDARETAHDRMTTRFV